MAKKLILICLGCFMLTALSGQSWRKLRGTADEQFAAGDYAAAAENYEAAWRKKNRDELIYKAAEAYYILRDYRKAAEAYQTVKDKYSDYPLAGLKYARSLKQDGQYDKAIQAFREFNQNYTGQGKAILEEIIRTEIRGSELAKQLAAQAKPALKVNHISAGVNSDANEFAPLPFSDNVLYFTSTMGNKARIYRSQFTGGTWSKATTPENFPVIQGDHFAHGALTPDGSRFYFTICGADASFNNLSTRCEVFVIKRVSGTWSQPEKLPGTINVDGTTSTHPFVVHQGNQEFLYFSSNRGGGRGGLDLWYATRDLSANNNNFTNPVNLGPTINTLGDEMTPFLDAATGNLYFSSNGHVSIGGFDIFRSQGSATSWSVPENAGMPFNSPADDYYYAQRADGAGFFASNRSVQGAKPNTRHDDIFEFGGTGSAPAFRPVLQASVFDRATNRPVPTFSVAVYEVRDGQENLLYSRPFSGGTYNFELPPSGSFRVEVSSPGYEAASYSVMTSDPSISNYGQSVFLDQAAPDVAEPVAPQPNLTTPNPNRPANPNPPLPADGANNMIDAGGEMYTSRGLAPSDQFEFTTNAPRFKGIYYRVQLVALRRFDNNLSRFSAMQPYGQAITTEFVTEKDLHRILLGPYFSEEEARQALRQVNDSGFPKAFLVRYEDGLRYGRVNL